jgi:hypothetical protein
MNRERERERERKREREREKSMSMGAELCSHISCVLFVNKLFLVQLVSSCPRLFKLILFCFFIEKSETCDIIIVGA